MQNISNYKFSVNEDKLRLIILMLNSIFEIGFKSNSLSFSDSSSGYLSTDSDRKVPDLGK